MIDILINYVLPLCAIVFVVTFTVIFVLYIIGLMYESYKEVIEENKNKYKRKVKL